MLAVLWIHCNWAVFRPAYSEVAVGSVSATIVVGPVPAPVVATVWFEGVVFVRHTNLEMAFKAFRPVLATKLRPLWIGSLTLCAAWANAAPHTAKAARHESIKSPSGSTLLTGS